MLRIKQGATWGRFWSIQVDGAPVTDFTGWAARAQVRTTPEAVDPALWEWKLGGGAGFGLITLANSGVLLSHAGNDSDPWAWRLGHYDIKVTDAAGRDAFAAEGRAMVIPATTR